MYHFPSIPHISIGRAGVARNYVAGRGQVSYCVDEFLIKISRENWIHLVTVTQMIPAGPSYS